MRGFSVGNLTADGSLFFDASRFAAARWSLGLHGITFSGGTLTVKGGDGVNYEDLFQTNPADGVHHVIDVAGTAANLGLYDMDVLCSHFEFALTGSATPDFDITMYPEIRH